MIKVKGKSLFDSLLLSMKNMMTSIIADAIIVPIIAIPINLSLLLSYPIIPQELYKIKLGESIINALQIKLILCFKLHLIPI